MNIHTGDTTHGFHVARVRKVSELKGTLYEMEHVKSGAKLAWLSNQEDNKLFAVAFKTTPTDDTGVFHILEHSVLCGSEKYTAKEPFVELLKSSMQTFLNAMTFPDKTMYPISSRNETDFQNLMQVYLDAVFAPSIYQNPNIFYQEGWHYEIRDKEETPEYKGVVLNEMKGAFSSVEQVIQSKLNAALFPDNCYGCESGGNPKSITDLTYEQFLDAHRFYYHPSNSRIYLDGNMDIDAALTIIDERYLSRFDRENADHTIPLQNPVSASDIMCTYEIPEEEEEAGKTQMAFGNIIGIWEERKKLLAVQILGDYLTGSNDAPLKKALLQSGMVQDVNVHLYDGIQQPFVFTRIQNMDYENKDAIRECIRTELAQIVAEGLKREELEATMNVFEFQMRESSEPKGLMRCFNAMKAWLFDGDPLYYMTCDELFTDLRNGLKEDYFQKVLEEVFLQEEHTVTVYARPSKTIGQSGRKAEHQKLESKKASWTEKQLEEILAINEKLDQWQQTPDQPSDIASLPQLELSEVDPKPEACVTREMEQNGVKILYHPSTVQGIWYLNLYFALGEVDSSKLPVIGFMPNLLGNLPTKEHTVAELQRSIKKDIGSLNFNIESYSVPGNTGRCSIYLTVQCSVLTSKYIQAVKIIQEIVLETNWDDTDKIREMVMQSDEMFRQNIIMNGHSYAVKRAAAHFSAESCAKEMFEGYHCYQWLHGLASDYEKQISEVSNIMKHNAQETFCQNRMIVSVTASSETPDLSELILGFPEGDAVNKLVKLDAKSILPEFHEAIQIPAGISYAALGMNLNQLGIEYSGAIRVVSKILSLSYLWNEVRVQGGAYGAGCTVSETGNVLYYSYRDPNAARSLGVFRKAAAFIEKFCQSEEELDKFIIGSISDMEPLRSVRDTGKAADVDFFRGKDYEARIEEKHAMLSLNKKEILRYCEIFDQLAEQGAVCVIGHGAALEDCKNERLTVMSV